MKNILKRGSVYYWRGTVDGVRRLVSLGVTRREDVTGALSRVCPDRVVVESPRPVVSVSTLGDVIRLYVERSSTRRLRDRTVRDCVSSLLRVCGVDRSEVDRVLITRLTGETVTGYVRRYAGGLRSAVGDVTSARAVFFGLSIPGVEGFLHAPLPVVPSTGWRHPGNGVVESLEREAERLLVDDPSLWLGWVLGYWVGMRAGEIVASRVSWVIQQGSGWYVDIPPVGPGEWRSKSGRSRLVRVRESVAISLVGGRGGDEYIVPGSDSQRRRLVYRRLGAWCRGCGVVSSYPVHELRRLAGARWYTDHGAEVSQSWLGHASVDTTCGHYADLTRHPEPRG